MLRSLPEDLHSEDVPLCSRRVKLRLLLVSVALLFGACTTRDTIHTVRISVPDQEMILFRKNEPIASYPVSTSRFGLGDQPGSNATPLGELEVAKKIGSGAPSGMKFKNRHATGEIVPVNAPGRDPIVSRILWLKGLDHQNRNAYGRTIYIHGTTEEAKIGRPASYGCIRMRSRDVIELFGIVGVGAKVEIVNEPLPRPAVANAPVQSGGKTVAN